jgi:hypothetical protein
VGLQNATVVSVLATSGWTAGSLLAACGLGVVNAIVSDQRNTTLKSVPTCCNYDLQDGESPHPASYRGCNHAKQELLRRRNRRATTPGSAGRTFFSEYTTPIDHSLLLFAAPISSMGSNHHKKHSKSLQEKIRIRTPVKSQVSQCRLKM